jgi:hypothetical protein
MVDLGAILNDAIDLERRSILGRGKSIFEAEIDWEGSCREARTWEVDRIKRTPSVSDKCIIVYFGLFDIV